MSLGVLEQGRFRALPTDSVGLCGRLDRSRLIFNVQRPNDDFDRTLIYGRVRDGIRRVGIDTADGRTVARTGAGGGFLLVLRGPVSDRDVSVTPLR
jgi:hypothetical protein